MKKIVTVKDAPAGHWVGDGFPVRSMFSYNDNDARLSPFLLLDYAGPAAFAAGTRPRGVGQHPHRGFETVATSAARRSRSSPPARPSRVLSDRART